MYIASLNVVSPGGGRGGWGMGDGGWGKGDGGGGGRVGGRVD